MPPSHRPLRSPLRRSLDSAARLGVSACAPRTSRANGSSTSTLDGRLAQCFHPRLSRHLTLSFNRSKRAHVAVLVPFLAPFYQPSIMPVRKVGSGPAKVSNAYKPLKSVPMDVDHERFRPGPAPPYQVEPWAPVETRAPEPSFANPSPPTNFSFPPQGSVPAPAPYTRISTEPSFVPRPITKSLPITDPFPAQNRLKSPSSVPALLSASRYPSWMRVHTERTPIDVRPGVGPRTTLNPSKSNPFLNRQVPEHPQLDSDPTIATLGSASSMDFSGSRARYTPRPPSMLDLRPVQPPPVNIPLVVAAAHNPSNLG